MRIRHPLAALLAAAAVSPAGAAGAIRPAFAVSGAPESDGGRGALVVTPLDGRGAARVYRPQDVGLPAGAPGDRFGAAVAAVGAGGDVVVGAPGREGRGAVYLVRAGEDGRLGVSVPRRASVLDGARSRLLATGVAAGDELGAGVAVAAARGRFQHLWVGAPGRRGGQGEVVHRLLRAGTPTGPVTTYVAGTRAAPGAGDRGFGAVLAALPRGALVGLPDAAGPGGEPAAGAVTQLRLRVTGPGSGRRDRYGQRISPPGFAAGEGARITLPSPAAGDRFGAALSSHGGTGATGGGGTVAGAPGVDVAAPAGSPGAGGVVAGAGAVATLGKAGVKRVLTQADAVVAGDPVPGGGFGAGVATGFAFYEQSGVNLAVLAPGAGTVTFVERDQGQDGPATGSGTGAAVALPGATAITTVPPDYAEEDAEDALVATTGAGGALTTGFEGGFERSAAVALPQAGAGRLVPAVPYRD